MPCAIQLALILHLLLMGIKAVFRDRARHLPLGGSDIIQFGILMIVGVAVTELHGVLFGD